MEKKLIKKNAEKLNRYILGLDRETQSQFLCALANAFDISLSSVQNLRYGACKIGKLKQEKIEQIAGVKIFEE
jgi:translation elongation factor EF-Tu-like GTPase